MDGSIRSHDVAMNETLIDATAPDRSADLTSLSESGKGQAWLGEDRVVLGYRDDLALRARASDEEAEDEMTVLIAAERQRARAQDDIARAAGLPLDGYRDIERGAAAPTLEVLDRLSAVLDLDPVWLRRSEGGRAAGA